MYAKTKEASTLLGVCCTKTHEKMSFKEKLCYDCNLKNLN